MAIVESTPKDLYDERDIILNAFETVDNRLDDLVGIRPLRHIAKPLTAIAPGNVIHKVTGLPKPSTLIEGVEDKIVREVGSKAGSMKGRMPSMPELPELPF
ncbi:MAG: hypothetical protein O8C67_05080 [Candidatus Methanoperedens sp.]|nr:hypothetical protein [Candidatus Methanoperedens sp.]